MRVRTGVILLVSCLAIIVAQRARFFTAPLLNPDEAIWVIGAEWMRQGGVPYADFVDNRPPGMFVIYSLAVRLTPWHAGGARLLLTACLCATAVLLFASGARAGSPGGGALAALAFSMSCGGFEPSDFQAAESEGFMATWSTLAFFALLSALDRPRAAWMLLWGAASFAAIGIKQPAAADALGMAAGLAGLALAGRVAWSTARRCIALATVGGLLLLLPLVAWAMARGALDEMIYASLTYPLAVYARPPGGVAAALLTGGRLACSIPVIFVAGLVTAPLTLLFDRSKRGLCLAGPPLLGWAVGALCGAVFGAHPFGHYFLQAVPPLALAAGLVIEEAWVKGRAMRRAVAALAMVVVSLPGILTYVVRSDLPARFLEQELGDLLRSRTHPEERLFVWGYLVENYYYSERLPVCADITTQFMSGWDPWVRSRGAEGRMVALMADRCVAELERSPPAFIIDYSRAGYVPLQALPRLAAFRDRGYRRVLSTPTSWWGGEGVLDVYERLDRDGGLGGPESRIGR